MPRRPLLALACALALALAGTATASAATVHLRGTAYEFNNTKVRLGGAQIRVAEDPTLGATTRADGTYDLKVPAGRKVTPYINAAGHHTIYLQTFTTRAGDDLANVNFQTPSDAVYSALATLLQVPLAPDGNPAQCAIVSTFSTRDVRGLDYADFVAYGAHGVAGATATASPAIPNAPVYFNKDVIPDRSQPKSSADGGVIWTGVPTGTYKITGHHPTTRFAPFTATCAPGRIVNANPPWGLHELGLPNPTTYTSGWDGVRAKTFTLAKLPRGARVTLTYAGKTTTLVTKTTKSTLDVAPRLPRTLRAGRTLSLAITANAYDGVRLDLRLRARRAPIVRATALPLGGPGDD
jgi:hypothetical protein